ncbi:hypothetical protein OS493_019097 [Desmophyllum pertusum]|uniref:Uncharacterized protein n=1 Tax=Desmophyllum pertusum TaxID=174260 RepID=A0A9X0CM83_9CNID|nr:hypothetical protein OS493_019097 [Desmophyllum pertusum]
MHFLIDHSPIRLFRAVGLARGSRRARGRSASEEGYEAERYPSLDLLGFLSYMHLFLSVSSHSLENDCKLVGHEANNIQSLVWFLFFSRSRDFRGHIKTSYVDDLKCIP